MSQYTTLKAAIQQVIKTNGNNEITGALLQQSLLSMINSLGADYQFAGVAVPTTNPGTPDQNVFYIAGKSGTYSNFDGSVVLDNEVVIFSWNGAWTKTETGIGKKINEISPDLLGRADVPGFINTSGAISNPSSGWYSSDFIPVKPGLSYTGRLYMASGNPFVTFYSEDKRFLSNVLGTVTGYEDKTGTVPDGAAYLRFSTYRGGGTSDNPYIFKIFDYILFLGNYTKDVEQAQNNIWANQITKEMAHTVGFLQSDGTLYQQNRQWQTTDYIFVYGIAQIRVCLSQASGSVYLCFYDADKNLISANNSYSAFVEKIIDVPSNAVYFRASFQYTTTGQYINGIEKTFREITNHNQNILSKFLRGQKIYVQELWNNASQIGFISDSSGSVYSNVNYRVSEYIPVLPGPIYIHLFSYQTDIYLAFYDENKNFLSATNYVSFSNQKIVAPSGTAYMRISMQREHLSDSWFWKGDDVLDYSTISCGLLDPTIASQTTTNTGYVWFQVSPRLTHVDRIRFIAKTGTTNFYKVNTNTTPATLTLLGSVVNSSADNNTIKQLDVNVNLGTGEYIGINGSFAYASGGATGFYGGYCAANGTGINMPISGFGCGFEVVSFINKIVEELIGKEETQIVTVDATGNGDYTNILDALKYTKGFDTAQHPITIIIKPGTYQTPTLLPSEFSSYCSNRFLAIIGTDKVNCILRNDNGYYNASGSDPDNLGDNSVIKISGNVYIANLTLIATDDENESETNDYYHRSYCLHVDAPAVENSIFEVHNCNLINDHAPCIGFGIPKKCTLKITDCELRSDFYNPNATYGGAIIYGHDRGGSETVVEEHLIIKNCMFISSNGHAVKTINNQNQLMDCIFVNNACALPSGKGIVLGTLTTVIPPSFGNSIEEMNA